MDRAPLYCDEDRILTSAGSAAGIDLCLHIVRSDYGTEIADRVARRLVTQYTTVAAARELGMSQRTFHRKFHALTGENYGLWVSRQRLERAKNLLRETDLNIEQITEACGFASSGSLRRLFRDSTDGSPSEYRKTHSRRT